MPRRETERLADALLRVVRPTLLRVLDAAVVAQQDSEPGDELSPEDEARVDACVARRRQRDREQRQGQGKRCRPATPRTKAQ